MREDQRRERRNRAYARLRRIFGGGRSVAPGSRRVARNSLNDPTGRDGSRRPAPSSSWRRIGPVKLVLLGGAGFRTPAMYEAVHDVRDLLGIDELVLYDVDDARLPRVLRVLEGIDRERGSRVNVRATADLDDALEGADVVYSAIRVGGIASRIVDETVPLAHGVLGQETTGPGGIAFALRTIPVMRMIAERTAARAPRAWFMNFTNPAGMITEAIAEVLGDRAFGICDTPRGMFRRIAARARPPAGDRSGSTTPGSTTSATSRPCWTAATTCCRGCSPTTRCSRRSRRATSSTATSCGRWA